MHSKYRILKTAESTPIYKVVRVFIDDAERIYAYEDVYLWAPTVIKLDVLSRHIQKAMKLSVLDEAELNASKIFKRA